MLDDDFLRAYEHGVVIECCDGVKRRFYFRIFAYSADYPEKFVFHFLSKQSKLLTNAIRVLLSSIRNMGGCPCPRCLIPKGSTHLVGTEHDRNERKNLARVNDLEYRKNISDARKEIYQNKRVVDGVTVQRLLKAESLVPTEVLISLICSVHDLSIYLLECFFK